MTHGKWNVHKSVVLTHIRPRFRDSSDSSLAPRARLMAKDSAIHISSYSNANIFIFYIYNGFFLKEQRSFRTSVDVLAGGLYRYGEVRTMQRT